MSKQVIVRIDQGDFEQGFPVTLTIKYNGEVCSPEVTGKLAPAPEILDIYNIWQKAYCSWGQSHRWWRRRLDIPEQINTNYSSDDSDEDEKNTNNYARQFEAALNEWLDRSDLGELREELLHTVNRNDSVSFIVQTDNKELQKLPWELWRLLKNRYHQAEVALSSRRSPKKGALSSSVKILVILGSDEKIDIQTDWNIFREHLPNSQLFLLSKPRADELRETLINEPWDIIFFAGHSSTKPEKNDGQIWINEQEYLSPQQLRNSLDKAVKNGLKLAIFNSCDGLGLARQLETLQIPHIIVMREPIHDQVAQRFLKAFLTSFAEGASLNEAVREARDQLRLIENDSPNASWLPVIFQNPEEPPLFYPLKEPSPTVELPKNSATRKKIQKFVWWGMGAIALTTLSFGIYKIIELHNDSTLVQGISLGEEILSKNTTPEKQAGVKAFQEQNYSKAVANFQASLQKNPNDPEAKIYLNNAKAANSKQTIKIAVSVPFGGNQEVAEEIARGVAEVQEEINRDFGINGLPLQVVIANDNNDSKLAQEIARKFVKDSAIFAVIGHNASNVSVAVSSIYKEGKLVMISPTSFANQLQESSYVFRMVPQITFFAAQLSKGLGKAIPQPKIAICVDNVSPDQYSFRNEFKYVVSAYKGQHLELHCNMGDPNFNVFNVVEEISNNNVNSLLVAAYVNNLPKAIELFKTVKENQLPIKLFGSPTLYTEQTLKLGGKAVEGLILSVPYYPDEQEKNSFRKIWKTELNTWRSPLAKDTTKAIATGLEQLLKQPQPHRQELDKILRDPNFKVKGVTGEFKFSADKGEREFLFQQGRTDALIQVKNGKFVKIE